MIEKIAEVAEELRQWGDTSASTGERIAAAFALNRQDLLPEMYADMVQAWDRLEPELQQAVRRIRREHLVPPCKEARLPPRMERTYLQDLVRRLRSMGHFKRDDLSICGEAADALQAVLDAAGEPGP